METLKLTEQEIEDLKTIQERWGAITVAFGQIDIEIFNLKQQKDLLIGELKTIKEKESTFAKYLNEKYGEGSINMETGEFIKKV